MKILHLSKEDTGGAGTAAMRLHRTMVNTGLDSNFLCLNKTTEEDRVVQHPKFYPRFYHRIIARFGLPLTRTEINDKRLNKITNHIEPEMYSFPETDYKIHEHELFKHADIVIIHWIAGFLDYESFFKNIPEQKKVYWYTHDFSSIMGGFHMRFDENRFNTQTLLAHELKLKQRKKKYLLNYKGLNFIANSSYTARVLKSSDMIKNQEIHCIPLGLPRNEFSKIDKSKAKEVLGFNQTDFIVLTASTSIDCKRKGFDRLHDAFESHPDLKDNCIVMTLGSDVPENNENINFKHMGSVWNPIFKSIIFSAADVVVSTSYEETFGQTIIEGYACGTPAIVFNNAALPELVIPDETGYIVNNIDEFARSLSILVSNRVQTLTMGHNAYRLFKEKYTSESQLQKLVKLFNTN